jgi:hypothetical protein
LCSSKDAPTNPRGIPFAPFVDKVEDYVSSREEVETTLKSFQEMISCVLSSGPLSLAPVLTDGDAGNISSWRSIPKGGLRGSTTKFQISRRRWRQCGF